MEKLTYKLVYTPNKESFYSVCESNINFLCADNKIHIRLRDYDKEEVISGFIGKLTYLVTYLVNYVEGANKDRFASDDDLLAWATSNINEYLGKLIRMDLHDDSFKGLKISKNFRRIKNYSKLGSIANGLCPYSHGQCSLSSFIETMRISLYDFLFNDAYEVVIVKSKDKRVYQKYVNKKSIKKQIVDKSIKLW